MFFWVREVIGWVLVAIALWLVRLALLYVGNRQVVEAGVVGFVLLGVLKAGIYLIRVSTAARIAAVDKPNTRGS